MKPVSLLFQCFGPYMEPQFIDFTQLEQSGLFLICGETGAGKTTILDAMCYALYGKSSGGLRGELEVMRCKLAGKDDETRVEFVFDCGGKRYLFTRSLRMRRKNLSDEHNCLVWDGSVFVPIFENPKLRNVNQMAQELIGLTYEQFRQVIILPQGQFERLLVSSSPEKEEILVSLFHADRWQQMAEDVYARVSSQDAQLRQELERMAARLASYGCRSLEELEQTAERRRKALAEAGDQLAQAEAQAQDRRQAYDKALMENSDFQELARRRDQLRRLEDRHVQMDQERELIQRDHDAEAISPQYDAYCQTLLQRESAQKAVEREEQSLEAAKRQLGALLRRKTAHDAAREQHEQQRGQIIRLDSAQSLYAALDEKAKAAKAARAGAEAAEKELAAAEAAWEASDRRWRQAMERQARIMDDYREAQQLYFRNISGILAQELAEGQPCPVCGSTLHPSLAALPGGQMVSREELDQKNQALMDAGKSVRSAADLRDEAERSRSQAAGAFSLAERRAAAAQSEYEALAGQKIPDIDSSAALEQRLRQLRRLTEAYEEEERSLSALLAQAQGEERGRSAALELARSALAEAEAAYQDRSRQWNLSLANRGFAGKDAFLAARMEQKDREKRRTALIRYQTELATAREALAQQQAKLQGREAPDMARIDAQRKSADAALKELTRRQALAQREADAAREELAALRRQRELHDQRRATVDEDLDFANRLMGRSGISLRRYVLGVMLTSITWEANRLLESVHGGRYQLYRTDEIAGSGRKGGLELEVLDRRSGQRRSVTTLSGGEKFLVALSLAIGLSAVVQAQGGGVRLEAMFIDEGFGSLDAASIDDALEVLQGVQRSHGLVGIISHVQRLAETIPSKLEIVKTSAGSQCRMH